MRIPTPTACLREETLQAYRALLRAASYLPDSAAREYIHNHIISRFKAVAPPKPVAKIEPSSFRRPLLRPEIKKPDPLSKRRLRYAWKCTRCLERAARGVEDDLKRVLDSTYGRRGKRRRELLHSLLMPTENSLSLDKKALEELIASPSQPPNFNAITSEKLRTFLQSQQMYTSTGLRQLAPQIPKENAWGRPVPLKLQKSMSHRWWTSTLGKLMPPLPIKEWNRLRDLATGRLLAEDLLPRRTRPRSEPLSQGEVNQKVLQLFRSPFELRNIDDIIFDPEKGLTINQPNPSDEDSSLPPKHYRSQRSLRRIYARIWSMTPRISQDGVTKNWLVEWGKGNSAAHHGEVTRSAAKDLELFEGIDLYAGKQRSRRGKKAELWDVVVELGAAAEGKQTLG